MTSIPGTNYQISGSNFVDPKGQEITPQDFLKKVESKEISLTEDSLRFLQNNVGPDMLKSLRTGAGLSAPVAQVVANLKDTELNFDATMMSVTIAKLAQKLDESMSKICNSKSELSFEKTREAIEKDKSGAGWKLAAGIASGVFSIASGAVSIAGATRSLDGVSKDLDRAGKQNIVGEDAFKALPEEVRNQTVLVNRELAMQIGKAQSDSVGGLGQATTSVIGHFGTLEEQKAREIDLEAKKAEHEANLAREVKNSAQQVGNKVMDGLMGQLNSEVETARSMARSLA